MSKVENVFLETSRHIAESTNDVITPANLISFAGLVSVLRGAKSLDTWEGVLKTSGGLAVDVLDGKVARYTGTNSALGEKIDATFDKVKIGYFVTHLWRQNSAPKGLIKAVVAQNGLNTAITLYDQLRNEEQKVHPSKAGKHGMFAQSTGLGLHAIGSKLKEAHPSTGAIIKMLGSLVGFSGVALSTLASYEYAKQARSGNPRR